MRNRSYEQLRKLHPCLSETAGKTGRIHLPVSPVCNLGCRYCKRVPTASEERPGTARGILPVEAVETVIRKARELCPEITTAGIAGPGEALASPHALKAFQIVDREFPDMIKCLSTNGLMLAEKAEELAETHVDSVTVTVNAVNPVIEAKINKKIFFRGEWIFGEKAAEILIGQQLLGIRKAFEFGITVKINTVLIPGINDTHIGEIALKTAEAGASICNLIPLIPQADMAGLLPPGRQEIETARREAGEYLDVFRHCRHCRADAAGTLKGTDIGRLVYGDLEPAEETFSHG